MRIQACCSSMERQWSLCWRESPQCVDSGWNWRVRIQPLPLFHSVIVPLQGPKIPRLTNAWVSGSQGGAGVTGAHMCAGITVTAPALAHSPAREGHVSRCSSQLWPESRQALGRMWKWLGAMTGRRCLSFAEACTCERAARDAA